MPTTTSKPFKFRPKRDVDKVGRNNEDRALRARAALEAYIQHTGDREDISHLQDLLCDLMHLADMEAAEREDSFEEALSSAVSCYLEER